MVCAIDREGLNGLCQRSVAIFRVKEEKFKVRMRSQMTQRTNTTRATRVFVKLNDAGAFVHILSQDRVTTGMCIDIIFVP